MLYYVDMLSSSRRPHLDFIGLFIGNFYCSQASCSGTVHFPLVSLYSRPSCIVHWSPFLLCTGLLYNLLTFRTDCWLHELFKSFLHCYWPPKLFTSPPHASCTVQRAPILFTGLLYCSQASCTVHRPPKLFKGLLQCS
jgi:hypothetical protein